LVKSFLGTSPEAVKTQLWTALIAVMLMKYLQYLCGDGWSLSGFIALIRLLLKDHDDVLELIPSLHPGQPPPPPKQVPRLFGPEIGVAGPRRIGQQN
jgi:hypothetical protein